MGSFQALAGYKRLLYGAETSKHTRGESCWCQMCEALVSDPAVNKTGPLKVGPSCKDPVLISRAAANAL